MNDKDLGQKRITPEQYRKILLGLELKNLFLISCSSKFDRASVGADVNVKVDDKATFGRKEKNEIEIRQTYSFGAKNQTSKKNYLTIKCEYCLSYSSKEEFTEEFFEMFKRANLHINSWPFFRELVYSLTSRMYIPPITLPLLKR